MFAAEPSSDEGGGRNHPAHGLVEHPVVEIIANAQTRISGVTPDR
jgi:hypothetical protein